MFISESQAKDRLANPKNLANRFKRGRSISLEQAIIERELGEFNAPRGIPEICETSDQILETENEPREELQEKGIQFREIKRPGNTRPWLSKQKRTEIAAEAINVHEVGQKEIARRHGVAISTVSDIINNKRRVESPRSVDPNLIANHQAKIDEALDKVREAAIDRLMSGLGQLTDDKISAHNAKDISTVCSNMARVVQQTIPQEKGAQAINLIVYTPELRTEQNFQVVEVES